jgi:hypothetical protein
MVRARHWHLFTAARGWRDSGRRSFCVHGDLSGWAVDSMLGDRVQCDGASASKAMHRLQKRWDNETFER